MNSIEFSKNKLVVGFKGIACDIDQTVADMAYARAAHNFAFDRGVLTGELGIDAGRGFYPAPFTERHAYPAIPTGKALKKLFLYRYKTDEGKFDDRLVGHLDDGTFVYTSVFKNDVWHAIDGLCIVGDVCAVNYNFNGKDTLLISCDNDYLYYLKGSYVTVCTKAPEFSSLTIHNERVFGSVNGAQNQVWFSDEFNPSEWSVASDKAGFITFSDDGGEVLKVVSFLNYLYIFREYGIFRLTAYGEQSEFVLKKVFTDTGRIVKASIELCGDKIVFYAEDGLFVFDGYDVKRAARKMPEVKSGDFISGAYLDDCYYIACKTGGEEKQDTLIRYRFKDDSFAVLQGVAILHLIAVRVHNGSQLLCVMGGDVNDTLGEISKSGCVLGTPTQKHYESPENTLFTTSLKIVRCVYVQTKSDITLTVKLDGRAFKYDVSGGDGVKTVRVERAGRTVGFEIDCSEAEANITPLTVSYDKLKM